MRLTLSISLAILLGSAMAAAAREPRSVAAGGTVRIGPFIALTADCASLGTPTLSMIQSPTLGSLSTMEAIDKPTFPDRMRAHDCNDRPVPVTTVIYHARPDATGTDTFIFELVYDFHKPRRYRYTVVVR